MGRRRKDVVGGLIRRAAIGVALAAMIPVAELHAGPVSFAGSTTAVFNNPIGGESWGAGTSTISFGTPPGALSFTGASFTGVAAGQTFIIGSIGYYNAENSSPLCGVDLSLTLDGVGGLKGPTTVTVPMMLANSPNPGEPDRVYIEARNAIGSIVGADGANYQLRIMGFDPGCECGDASELSKSLWAREGQIVCASLFGQLVAEEAPTGGTPPGGGTPQTPEPMALAMAMIGVATIGVRRFCSARR